VASIQMVLGKCISEMNCEITNKSNNKKRIQRVDVEAKKDKC